MTRFWKRFPQVAGTAADFWKKTADRMYLDSAYLAKIYVNEHDSRPVRAAIRRADALASSAWSLGEVTCVFHRHMREGSLKAAHFRELLDAFRKHVDSGIWTLIPIGDRLQRRMSSLVSTTSAGVYLRAADAIHLATAMEVGEHEVWTSDRHMLAAAPHFGLTGRTV